MNPFRSAKDQDQLIQSLLSYFDLTHHLFDADISSSVLHKLVTPSVSLCIKEILNNLPRSGKDSLSASFGNLLIPESELDYRPSLEVLPNLAALASSKLIEFGSFKCMPPNESKPIGASREAYTQTNDDDMLISDNLSNMSFHTMKDLQAKNEKTNFYNYDFLAVPNQSPLDTKYRSKSGGAKRLTALIDELNSSKVEEKPEEKKEELDDDVFSCYSREEWITVNVASEAESDSVMGGESKAGNQSIMQDRGLKKSFVSLVSNTTSQSKSNNSTKKSEEAPKAHQKAVVVGRRRPVEIGRTIECVETPQQDGGLPKLIVRESEEEEDQKSGLLEKYPDNESLIDDGDELDFPETNIGEGLLSLCTRQPPENKPSSLAMLEDEEKKETSLMPTTENLNEPKNTSLFSFEDFAHTFHFSERKLEKLNQKTEKKTKAASPGDEEDLEPNTIVVGRKKSPVKLNLEPFETQRVPMDSSPTIDSANGLISKSGRSSNTRDRSDSGKSGKAPKPRGTFESLDEEKDGGTPKSSVNSIKSLETALIREEENDLVIIDEDMAKGIIKKAFNWEKERADMRKGLSSKYGTKIHILAKRALLKIFAFLLEFYSKNGNMNQSFLCSTYNFFRSKYTDDFKMELKMMELIISVNKNIGIPRIRIFSELLEVHSVVALPSSVSFKIAQIFKIWTEKDPSHQNYFHSLKEHGTSIPLDLIKSTLYLVLSKPSAPYRDSLLNSLEEARFFNPKSKDKYLVELDKALGIIIFFLKHEKNGAEMQSLIFDVAARRFAGSKKTKVLHYEECKMVISAIQPEILKDSLLDLQECFKDQAEFDETIGDFLMDKISWISFCQNFDILPWRVMNAFQRKEGRLNCGYIVDSVKELKTEWKLVRRELVVALVNGKCYGLREKKYLKFIEEQLQGEDLVVGSTKERLVWYQFKLLEHHAQSSLVELRSRDYVCSSLLKLSDCYDFLATISRFEGEQN